MEAADHATMSRTFTKAAADALLAELARPKTITYRGAPVPSAAAERRPRVWGCPACGLRGAGDTCPHCGPCTARRREVALAHLREARCGCSFCERADRHEREGKARPEAELASVLETLPLTSKGNRP